MSADIPNYAEAEAAVKKWQIQGSHLLKPVQTRFFAAAIASVCWGTLFFIGFQYPESAFAKWLVLPLMSLLPIYLFVLYRLYLRYHAHLLRIEGQILAEIIPLVFNNFKKAGHANVKDFEFELFRTLKFDLANYDNEVLCSFIVNKGNNDFTVALIKGVRDKQKIPKDMFTFVLRFNSDISIDRIDIGYTERLGIRDYVRVSTSKNREFFVQRTSGSFFEPGYRCVTTEYENRISVLNDLTELGKKLREYGGSQPVSFLSFDTTRVIYMPLDNNVFRLTNSTKNLSLSDDILPHMEKIREMVELGELMDTAIQTAGEVPSERVAPSANAEVENEQKKTATVHPPLFSRNPE